VLSPLHAALILAALVMATDKRGADEKAVKKPPLENEKEEQNVLQPM